MNRLTLWLAAPALVVVFLIPAPATVDADVIRLRTGVNIKGIPRQDQSDTEHLVIEDLLTGAIRRVRWDVVATQDRDRIQVLWELKDDARQVVDGHRLRRRMQSGDIDDVLGLVLNKGGNPVRIMTGGDEISIPADDVVEVLDEKMDPRDIWSAEQLYEKHDFVVKGPSTTDQHWALGQYAEWLGLYEKAKEHFETCAQDEQFLKNVFARQRLERVEALLRDKAALDKLREIRMAVGYKSFRRARSLLESFEADHPGASEAVLRRLEKANKSFVERRNAYFQKEARAGFYKIINDLLRDKVREKKSTYSDVFAYIRREMTEIAFAKLAERLSRKDDVSVADAKGFWEARPKKRKQWWSASFGGGTFIARPPKPKKSTRRPSSGSRKKSGGNTGPVPKTPPKPTRDSWWAKASFKERASHMLARYAEDSSQFEISENEKPSLCPTCNGRGLQEKTLSNGSMWSYLCTRCAGAQHDIRIRFR